jgi:hypothetical protein
LGEYTLSLAASARRIGSRRFEEAPVFEWLHEVSVWWMIAIIFSATFAVTAGIFVLVMVLAVGERGRSFKTVSPGMLPPMGLLFALLIGFLAAQVWSDTGQAQGAVNHEASELRSVVLLAHAFPGGTEARMDALVRRQIRGAAEQEWPAMADHRATLTVIPVPLAQALQLALVLDPQNAGQTTAQREIVTALQGALDARRQRIILSESSVNWAKWAGVILLAILTLVAIALVHSDNRLGAALAMGLFAAAVATSLVLIASQDHPFSGPFAVGPDVLQQVMPH